MSEVWKGHSVELHYVDPDSNSNKFYRITTLHKGVNGSDFRVLYQWGRIGSVGQSSFKMFNSVEHMTHTANRRQQQKMAKGYVMAAEGFPSSHNLDRLLRLAGVNTEEGESPADSDGVTFDEMSNMVQQLLSTATGEITDVADVAVETAQMNAKFESLRRRYEAVQSDVEFVNAAVRSRM
jgi:predicted DNA-binding WGR domain protein